MTKKEEVRQFFVKQGSVPKIVEEYLSELEEDEKGMYYPLWKGIGNDIEAYPLIWDAIKDIRQEIDSQITVLLLIRKMCYDELNRVNPMTFAECLIDYMQSSDVNEELRKEVKHCFSGLPE